MNRPRKLIVLALGPILLLGGCSYSIALATISTAATVVQAKAAVDANKLAKEEKQKPVATPTPEPK